MEENSIVNSYLLGTSVKKISISMHHAKKTIRNLLDKRGIARRNSYEGQKLWSDNLISPGEEQEIINYYQQGKGIRGIASNLHRSKEIVERILHKASVVRKKRLTSQYDQQQVFSPTNDQKQVILGSVLGDCFLKRPRSLGDNSQFKLKHKADDRGYIFWIWDMLKSTSLFPDPPKLEPNGKSPPYWGLISRSHPIFTEYRKLFYPAGTKIVTSGILNQLDDLGVAVWVMDDGSLDRKHKKFKLCTNGFTYEENKLISEWFILKYNLALRLAKKVEEDGHHNYFLISRHQQELRDFLSRIDYYLKLVPCMARKRWSEMEFEVVTGQKL